MPFRSSDRRITRSPDDLGARSSADSPDVLQTPMLEVEFAQLSDRGRVRELNEDYLGYVAPSRRSECVPMAGCLCWPMALGDRSGVRSLRAPQWRVCSRVSVTPTAASPTRCCSGVWFRRPIHEVYDAGPAMATTWWLVRCVLTASSWPTSVIRVVISCAAAHAKLLTRDHTVANEHVRLGLTFGAGSR